MRNFTEQDLQEFLDASAVWGKNGSKELYDRACQFIMAFMNFIGTSPKKDEIIRHKCCDKWDRWGAVEDKEHKGFFIYVYFCPECGTQLKDKTCPYNKTTDEQILACVLNCYDCYERRLSTEIFKGNR